MSGSQASTVQSFTTTVYKDMLCYTHFFLNVEALTTVIT